MLNQQTYIDEITGVINLALIMKGEISTDDVEGMAMAFDHVPVNDKEIDRNITFTLTEMIVAVSNEDTERVVKCANCVKEALQDCGIIK